MRILLDTNLLVRAVLTPQGPARRILNLIETGEDHVLIVCDQLLNEIASVLARNRIRRRWPLTDEQVEGFCGYLARVAERIVADPLPAVISDPKDRWVIETAVAGRVSALCTLDAHFGAPAVREFCEAHGIRILSDIALLQVLVGTERR